jgi:hypothetical protein
MNQLDPSRSRKYIRGALDGMCTETDGSTDNLSDGQHQLPTKISIIHSTTTDVNGHLPGNSDTSDLDRRNLREVKRSTGLLANGQSQEQHSSRIRNDTNTSSGNQSTDGK